MVFIGYHASHEQLPPSELLTAVQRAESIGFDGAMCSDHLAPWGVAQGHSGFSWSWLGAALATTSFSIGCVHAPGQRMHPVISAQAIATLEEMFPARFWTALGSGEALNEHVTGDAFPPKEVRNERLDEARDVIARLLGGEEVTHDGLVRVHRARLWSLPASSPPLFIAAVTAPTAARFAGWADGLATVGQPRADLEKVIGAYREAGGTGPAVLQLHVCLADDEPSALATVREEWRQGVLPVERLWEIEQPEDFDAATAGATDDELRRTVMIDTDAASLADRIADLAETGFDRVYLHGIGENQQAFLDRAEHDLLPALRERL